MNDIDVNGLLAQMRTLAREAGGAMDPLVPADRSGFGELLKASIDGVNSTQQRASDLAAAFETGQGDADLAEVMVAVQKAGLSFQAMTEVRNKLVDAYKEIMNMPV